MRTARKIRAPLPIKKRTPIILYRPPHRHDETVARYAINQVPNKTPPIMAHCRIVRSILTGRLSGNAAWVDGTLSFTRLNSRFVYPQKNGSSLGEAATASSG